MANKSTRDTGMRQRTVTTYRMDDPADAKVAIRALDEFSNSLPVGQPGDCGGDALRRHNADRCREILATVGLADDGSCVADTQALRDRGLNEHSAQWMAAHWLASHNTMTRARDLLSAGDTSPQNLARLIDAAEDMGMWQERMWWRAGIDNESGERREALALTGRPVKRGQKEAAAKTNQRHEQMWERRCERLKELLLTGINLESAAACCEAEGLGTAGAIVRQWNRRKEN